MNYLLDTNVISELISKIPNAGVIEFLNVAEEKSLFLSVITLGEIKAGIEKLSDGSKKEKLSNWLEIDLLNRFNDRIIDVDLGVMMRWGEIVSRSQALGRVLPIMDSLIAAQCAIHDLVLITRNQKDFENLSLTIINPFK
ncbi:type II toxin-antitoxin system VapC family toxin [Sulfuricurvum sp.]|uniref:type II toxin-antitoxin system VapC family toxin n=1 Tax=Sulfuricurvum sp. TaxID=2025608 RepID=UPI002609CF15|nr:type II toxin-antitoxin system VapC family toxin [Sulfuricurvum sp.]MDD2781504.1 type II toxin-antitoxin system VapC family toxin [Sulfuricurvum sp.]